MRRSGEKEAQFRMRQKRDVSRVAAMEIDRARKTQNQPQLGIKSTVPWKTPKYRSGEK